MKFAIVLAVSAIGVFMPQAARSGPPDPKLMKEFTARQDSLDRVREAAGPWKMALEKAFSSEADTSLGNAAAGFIFLSTYKHYQPPADADRDAKAAREFHDAWKKLAGECVKAKLPPVEMTETIYKLTNSDWAPVSFATGPGLDKLITPADLRAWGQALIAFGKRARAAKKDPAGAWGRQPNSYRVHSPTDLAKAELNPPPVKF